MSTTTHVSTPRIGARVLLLDPHDRVLLIHARDPDVPAHHWWELPGGGVDPGETLTQAATREVAEETGIQLQRLGPCLWIRESRFRYRNRDHHRVDHIFLARPTNTTPHNPTKPTANEKIGLIEHRWFTANELTHCPHKLLPPALPHLLRDILANRIPTKPIKLID